MIQCFPTVFLLRQQKEHNSNHHSERCFSIAKLAGSCTELVKQSVKKSYFQTLKEKINTCIKLLLILKHHEKSQKETLLNSVLSISLSQPQG